MRSQTYCYAGATHAHPRGLFRRSHLKRYQTAIALLDVRPDSRVLDYGSGDGFLITQLLQQGRGARLTALEPMAFLQEQFRGRVSDPAVSLAASVDDLPSAGYDRIACLEVLEHLCAPDLLITLQHLDRLLAPDGLLIVSVPLEIGPSALAKYVAARFLTRMDRWCSVGEILRVTFGLAIERDREGTYLSHKGYDYRVTRELLCRTFRISREVFSPISWLRGLLNAQVLWRLERRSATMRP
jgi:2-polyprenyl-3-methyl-5-hydroxy-6-metoxy-1,4-benzoquinol methylase